ncbi:hypothetical protein GCM10023321_70180 [Pseudonocardia eucalypti]|uniref:Uncharacterized protein n=1 Tax=Pseudonocardia eucalypti TaxID=648755 RepID=A0ABP9R4P9_9PSEU
MLPPEQQEPTGVEHGGLVRGDLLGGTAGDALSTELDVFAAAQPDGAESDRTLPPGAGHRQLVLDCVFGAGGDQYRVDLVVLPEDLREQFDLRDGAADVDHRLALGEGIGNLLRAGGELLLDGAVSTEGEHLHVARIRALDRHHPQPIDLCERADVALGAGAARRPVDCADVALCTGGTGQPADRVVEPRILLRGDLGLGALGATDLQAVLGLERLMQATAPTLAGQQVAGVPVDDDDLPVRHDVRLVHAVEVVCPQGLPHRLRTQPRSPFGDHAFPGAGQLDLPGPPAEREVLLRLHVHGDVIGLIGNLCQRVLLGLGERQDVRGTSGVDQDQVGLVDEKPVIATLQPLAFGQILLVEPVEVVGALVGDGDRRLVGHLLGGVGVCVVRTGPRPPDLDTLAPADPLELEVIALGEARVAGHDVHATALDRRAIELVRAQGPPEGVQHRYERLALAGGQLDHGAPHPFGQQRLEQDVLASALAQRIGGSHLGVSEDDRVAVLPDELPRDRQAGQRVGLVLHAIERRLRALALNDPPLKFGPHPGLLRLQLLERQRTPLGLGLFESLGHQPVELRPVARDPIPVRLQRQLVAELACPVERPGDPSA